MPPEVLPQTARTIGIEDIDRGVVRWFDRIVDVHVMSPQGDRRKVTVKFSAGERWVAAADRQGIRDRDGRLILPVIMVSRVGVESVSTMSALGAGVPTLQVARLVSERGSDLANLDSLRPISQRRLRDSTVYDVYTVPFPSSTIINYRVRVQCQYWTHVNEVVQKILSSLNFHHVPSFVIGIGADDLPVSIPSGDGTTERVSTAHPPFEARPPLSDYYVVGYIEGDLGGQGNTDEFTDQERILQLEFRFRVPATLMLDPEGRQPAVHRERTAFGITMGSEEIHVVDDPRVADRIFGRQK